MVRTPEKTYVVDLQGWGHVSTVKVEATSEAEAIEKAKTLKGIRIQVRKGA